MRYRRWPEPLLTEEAQEQVDYLYDAARQMQAQPDKAKKTLE